MFATVCALLIILAGAVCIPNLPVAMYPTLAPPQVSVSSNYVGANADTVEKAVTIPLEEAINGVEGMRYISSSSTNSGTSSITTTFKTGYDLDIAAVDVQNRVASVQGRLPSAVNATGITITKANSNFVFGAGFYTDDGRYSPEFISNYLDVYVKDAIKRVPGVGDFFSKKAVHFSSDRSARGPSSASSSCLKGFFGILSARTTESELNRGSEAS